MVMCCPLSECDETATVYDVSKRRARKEYQCCECRGAIGLGELHEHTSMLFDGAWSSYRMCLLCREIGDHFSCGNGRILETLWSDLEENFFPDMVAGGPCMQGLSPAAKARLVERRMTWYFDQDEIDDGAWEDWPKHRDRQRPIRAPIEREPEVHWSELPEHYWPRQLKLEAETREYEASKVNKQ